MKLKPNVGFALLLLLSNALVFGCHLAVLNSLGLNLLDHMLIPAYVINFSLALIIGLALYALRYKYTQSLGFIFLVGTGLKFLVFFIVFNPVYSSDADVERIEFATFFVPYTVNLMVETTFLVRVLNRMKETH
jgi:hypothetical protein